MNLTEERAARNEAVFREVNERIEELHNRLQGDEEDVGTFVCECSDDACAERLDVPMETYERVRNDPHLFLVAPGHSRPEVEHSAEQEPGFVVVRKDSPAAERIAEQTDPRS
jgi:hypothetical protein